MKKVRYIWLLVCWLLADLAFGQYLTVQDPAFAQCIAKNHPSLIINGTQLDTTAAKVRTGRLVCTSMGISMVPELNYFQKLTQINLSRNNIVSIASWDSLKSVQSLLLNNNKLKTIPPVNNLKSIYTFDVNSNDLDSMPSFKGMKTLYRLFIANNNLKAFPDLTGATTLGHVVANSNQIDKLPVINSKNLYRFLCSWNNLTEADFTSMPTLTQIHVEGNKLTKFPNIKGMTNMTELWVDQNQIDSIPDLSSYTKLSEFELNANYFTFSDLDPLRGHPYFANFSFVPQKIVGKVDTVIQKERSQYILALPQDSSLANTSYQWFKDGQPISTSKGKFVIPLLTKSNQGIYTCKITNSDFPNLVLTTAGHALRVVDCMDLSALKANFKADECKYPLTASIDESSILFASKPFSYQLTNNLTGKQSTFTNAGLSLPIEGKYDLSVTDSMGCSLTVPNFFVTNRPESCHPVFYPGLNASESSYFIDQKGKAVIYNSRGLKVKEIQVPSYWDGSDQQGRNCESGVYLIVINDQINLEISLMRVN